MSAKKQRTRRFRLRFYLILLVPILLVGAYIGYRILRPTTGRLGTDTVEGDMEFTGVIIRRENVAPSEDYHTIRYLVSEGDMVSGSQQVAYLYRKGYENQMSDIVSKEQQIYQQQITLLRLSSSDGMTVPDEVSDYNSRIEEVVNKMTQASLGKDGLDYIRLSAFRGAGRSAHRPAKPAAADRAHRRHPDCQLSAAGRPAQRLLGGEHPGQQLRYRLHQLPSGRL